MPWNKHGLIAHRPQAPDDAGNQRVVLALRQIGAANGAGKQHIAHKSTTNFGRMKHHMAGRMAGAVVNSQRAVTDRDAITVKQPARGRERLSRGQAKHLALLGQAIDPELVGRMRANDGQCELVRQLSGAARMINMGMGEPYLRQRQAPAPDFCAQQIEIATGVNNGRPQGLVTPDKGEVLLKGGDRNSVMAQHFYSVLGP